VGSDGDDGPIELILFGKVKPYKGADILIRAFARLPEALQVQCRLRVVGQPYMDTAPLVALANEPGVRDRVSFEFRRLPDDQIAGLYSGDSVAVFPYREIDASGVLMTAIAAGCPIVASRLGGFSETLTDGKNALLFAPGDDEALAHALARVIGSQGLRRELAEGVCRLREAIPSWQAIGRSTVALYRALIGLRAGESARFTLPRLERR
jgi:glycosyltransferase involved in cell wall biosynthesis